MKEALLIDQQDKTNLWREAIVKELSKNVEFQVFKTAPDGKPPDGYN